MEDEKNIHELDKAENKQTLEMQIYVNFSIYLDDCFVITGP